MLSLFTSLALPHTTLFHPLDPITHNVHIPSCFTVEMLSVCFVYYSLCLEYSSSCLPLHLNLSSLLSTPRHPHTFPTSGPLTWHFKEAFMVSHV